MTDDLLQLPRRPPPARGKLVIADRPGLGRCVLRVRGIHGTAITADRVEVIDRERTRGHATPRTRPTTLPYGSFQTVAGIDADQLIRFARRSRNRTQVGAPMTIKAANPAPLDAQQLRQELRAIRELLEDAGASTIRDRAGSTVTVGDRLRRVEAELDVKL